LDLEHALRLVDSDNFGAELGSDPWGELAFPMLTASNPLLRQAPSEL
jgi:hypothetical protein